MFLPGALFCLGSQSVWTLGPVQPCPSRQGDMINWFLLYSCRNLSNNKGSLLPESFQWLNDWLNFNSAAAESASAGQYHQRGVRVWMTLHMCLLSMRGSGSPYSTVPDRQLRRHALFRNWWEANIWLRLVTWTSLGGDSWDDVWLRGRVNRQEAELDVAEVRMLSVFFWRKQDGGIMSATQHVRGWSQGGRAEPVQTPIHWYTPSDCMSAKRLLL